MEYRLALNAPAFHFSIPKAMITRVGTRRPGRLCTCVEGAEVWQVLSLANLSHPFTEPEPRSNQLYNGYPSDGTSWLRPGWILGNSNFLLAGTGPGHSSLEHPSSTHRPVPLANPSQMKLSSPLAFGWLSPVTGSDRTTLGLLGGLIGWGFGKTVTGR